MGREAEGGHAAHGLAGDAERLTAGGKDLDAGTRPQHRVRQLGAGVYEVPAVV